MWAVEAIFFALFAAVHHTHTHTHTDRQTDDRQTDRVEGIGGNRTMGVSIAVTGVES